MILKRKLITRSFGCHFYNDFESVMNINYFYNEFESIMNINYKCLGTVFKILPNLR